MSIVTSRDTELPLLFEEWLLRGRRLVIESREKYQRWVLRAQGLAHRGERCPELDDAIGQVWKTLEVEAAFLETVRYDVEECMVVRGDQIMAKRYRLNTNQDLRVVREIAKEFTNLKDLD